MREGEFLNSIPFITCFLLFLNIIIHIIIFIFSFSLGYYSIIPSRVIYLQEFYRLITSAFTHNGILHILMNMMSLYQLGTSLENYLGSFQFLIVTLWSIPIISSLYIFCYWITAIFIFGNNSYLNQSAVGYSGVLFCYALLESYLSPPHTRSVYGLFNVSSRIYPWILLGAIQILLPNISFVGHLSGLLVGVLFVNGYLNFILPSIEFYNVIERNSYCYKITTMSSYVTSTNKIMPFNTTTSNSTSFRTFIGTILSYVQWIVFQIWNIFALVCHVIGIPLDRYIYDCFTSFLQILYNLKQKILLIFSLSENTTLHLNERYERISQNDLERHENQQSLQI